MANYRVIAFDVNETLSDMTPMGRRFADVGAPEHLAKLWFAMLLRDGFAITAAGGQEQFSVLGEGALRTVLSGVSLDRDLDAAISYIMSGFGELSVHPDVVEGVRALHAEGLRLVTLTNGSTGISQALLSRAGILEHFEALLSVEDADAWKPAPSAYRHAAHRCGVPVEAVLLAAVHPWDIDGAARVGMGTAWINRTDLPYPDYFTPPTYTVRSVPELAAALQRSS